MVKTLVYLEVSQLKSLRLLSRRQAKPVAYFLRDAVARYLKGQEQQPSLKRITGIAAGKRLGDISECADQILRKELGLK